MLNLFSRKTPTMLQFEGERDFQLTPAAFWAKLSDARFLIECIPGNEKTTLGEADQAACVVRPGFAFVRGTLELSVRFLEKVQDQSLRVEVGSKGIGSSSTVEISAVFVAAGRGDANALDRSGDAPGRFVEGGAGGADSRGGQEDRQRCLDDGG